MGRLFFYACVRARVRFRGHTRHPLMRRLLSLLTLLVVAPAVSAQAAFDLTDPSLSLDDIPPGTVLSVEDLAAIGITSDTPGVVARLAVEPIGYQLPADLLASEKDPTIATLLSVVIVGGGQIYSGEINRGLTLLGIGVGALIGSSLSGNSTIALVGLGVYLGAWVYGILDADDSARRMNAANGFALAPAALDTPVGMRPGVSTSLRF